MPVLKRSLPRLLAAALGLTLLAGAGNAADKVKVGVTAGDGEIIWEEVKKAAAPEGIDIQIIVFSDYNIPNAALSTGDLDLNAFQHRQFLAAQNKNRGYGLEPIGDTVVAPIGLYSKRLKAVSELKDGARVAIPNDPSNGGRALNLLQAQGLLKLKPGAGTTATLPDIVDNPKKLQIAEIDAAQLPRVLVDVDAAVINTNYALQADLNPRRDAIAQEAAENNPYANIIAVRAKDVDNPLYRKVVAIYQRPALKAFILDRFKGALIPAF